MTAAQTVVGPPDASQRAAIEELAGAAGASDGREPFGEQTRIQLAHSDPSILHVIRRDAAGRVVGYAQRDAAGTAELAVHPAARGRGHGRALLAALTEATVPLRVWSHSGHPAAAKLAAGSGLIAMRELWRMRRPLPLPAELDPAGPVALPAGVRVRPFEPGRDESAWLALNARAFASHGEQGRLDATDLQARLRSDWFRAEGFLLAERGADLVGFHWTKEHPSGSDTDPAGEVYVLGVDPAEQGTGLGSALLRLGLRVLTAHHMPTVLLYVDADNAAAVRVYQRLGFETEATSVMYARLG